MGFGSNVLSTIPADWTVTNGSMATESLSLEANGSAILEIDTSMLEELPELAQVTVVATSDYGTGMDDYVELIGISDGGTHTHFILPIVDVSTGIFRTTVEFEAAKYDSFTFGIYSLEGIEIIEWSLSVEVSDDYTEIIDGVERAIPKLLYDYNMYNFEVQQEQYTIGMISAYLLEDGDLQGHLLVNCTATEDSTVVIRFLDNEIEELYSPHEFKVKRGANSVGIPHAYIDRLAGIHTFIVTIQVLSGSITIETRGVMYTIDGGYLVERALDVGYNLFDITLKQLSDEAEPSWIYAVCIDEENALIRKRAYDEEEGVAWEPDYVIEGAQNACLDFYGDWVLRTGAEGFTLETDEYPYVMWIDLDGNLQAQYGTEEETRVQLATNVSQVRCCMAYNYTPDISYDQGLVCLYISDGIVYYRNLCRLDLDGNRAWGAQQEIELFGTGNTDIKLSRLNDYRMSFNAINSESQWLISDRGYVGQAIRPHHVRMSVWNFDVTLSMTTYTKSKTIYSESLEATARTLYGASIDYQLGADGFNRVSPTVVDYTWISSSAFTVIFDQEFVCRDDVRIALKVTDYGQSSRYDLSSVDQLSSTELQINLAAEIPDRGSVTLTITGDPALSYYAGLYLWPVRKQEVQIMNNLLHVEETLVLDVSSVSVEVDTTTYSKSTLTGPSESLELTLSSVATQITYIAYDEVPV